MGLGTPYGQKECIKTGPTVWPNEYFHEPVLCSENINQETSKCIHKERKFSRFFWNTQSSSPSMSLASHHIIAAAANILIEMINPAGLLRQLFYFLTLCSHFTLTPFKNNSNKSGWNMKEAWVRIYFLRENWGKWKINWCIWGSCRASARKQMLQRCVFRLQLQE